MEEAESFAVDDLFSIGEEVIDVAQVLASVTHPGAGGIDLFVGLVRDNNAGKRVYGLHYTSYEAMAKAELSRIAIELKERFPDVRLAAVHRIGELKIGDIAVACAASSAHRADAFSACRELIEQIKSRVPVWKKEIYEEGATWLEWEDARTDRTD